MTNNFLNKNKLHIMLEAYFYSIGIPVRAISSDRTVICAFGNDCICTDCHLNISDACRLSVELGEAYTFSCEYGVNYITYPVISEKAMIIAIVTGPFLMNDPEQVLVNADTLNSGQIQQFYTLPVKQSLAVYHIAKLNEYLFSRLSDSRLLEDNKLKMKQQSIIGENMHSIKTDTSQGKPYPYEKEKILIHKVKVGNIDEAYNILNELLAHILLYSGGNLEFMKANALQLCALLSRAAMEGGASVDRMLLMSLSFIKSLTLASSTVDLGYALMEVVQTFSQSVLKLSDSRNREIIKRAIKYMTEHYSTNITLDTVARYVHLNSAYFSSLFKKEVGLSFTEYLNKIRIEESKYLLQSGDTPIVDIATMVGFEDQSYYTKVFKKITGITPKQYRTRL